MRAVSRRAGATAILLAVGLLVLPAGVASGKGGHAPSGHNGKPKLKVTATGLNNPRGITVADGKVYVAESGRGGSSCQGEGEDQQCFGTTGAVTRISHHGQRRVVRNLPSVAGPDGTGATGPSDVSVRNGKLYITVGNRGGPETRAPFGPAGAALGRLVKAKHGGVRFVADLATFEKNNNPDKGAAAQPGLSIDSNPQAVLALDDKQLVVDAAGNDLLKVDHKGRISVVAVFPTHVIPTPPEAGLPPTFEAQPVPTSIVKGPDGAYYVGELTGFPFTPGQSRIWRIKPGHKPKVYKTGFTNVIDLAFDKQGRLLVLTIAAKGLLQAEGPGGDFTGLLTRVERNGKRTVLAKEGLVAPTGIAVDRRDGAIYISNYGVFPGSGPTPPGTGQVVRLKP
jgi:hypothetical protein